MMINKKKRNRFIQLLFVIALVVLTTCNVAAVTSQDSSLLTYRVNVTVSGGGSLYFDYGEDMQFFLADDYKAYHPSCRVNSPATYKFSKLIQRCFLPSPEEGYYFSGFYDNAGNPINLTKNKVDILRVSVDGIYYYDYYTSHEDSKYAKYTETAYKKLVKTYLKTLYGTSRYKKMDTIMLYKLPKKDASYTAKFDSKTAPDIQWNATKTKAYNDPKFYYLPKKTTKYSYTFKSSSKKIATIDKETGQVTIKGPGIATITCSIKETETTLAQSYTSNLIVKPIAVSSIQASQSKKTLQVKWKGKTHNSGYEIQVSNNKSFKNILATKNVKSGKTNTTTIKLKQELCHNYVRIRAYKTSKGRKLYSPYAVEKIENNYRQE